MKAINVLNYVKAEVLSDNKKCGIKNPTPYIRLIDDAICELEGKTTRIEQLEIDLSLTEKALTAEMDLRKKQSEEIERLTNEIARMEGEFSTEAFHESERNKKAIDLIGRCIIQFEDGTPDELEMLSNDINAFLNPKD